VVFLTLDDTADSLRRKLVKQPHAQYPVCGKNIDDVLGYMESKVILQLLLADESGVLDASASTTTRTCW
jgi:CBS domain containing-hemolysin-like protein